MVRRKRKRYKKKHKHTKDLFLFGCLVALIVFLGWLIPSHTFSLKIPWWVWVVLAIGVLVVVLRALYMWLREKHEKDAKFRRIAMQKSFQSIDPFLFEGVVAWVYRQYGYHTKKTQDRADEGIDIVMWDPGRRQKFVVQVKRYSDTNTVASKEVRDFFGSYAAEPDTIGIFITTGRFAGPAKKWGDKQPRLHLIDGLGFSKVVDEMP